METLNFSVLKNETFKCVKTDSLDFYTLWKYHSRIKMYRLDAWDKCSDLVHWEGPEGSGGEGGGSGDQDGEHM